MTTEDDIIAIEAYIAFLLRYVRLPGPALADYEQLSKPVLAWMVKNQPQAKEAA